MLLQLEYVKSVSCSFPTLTMPAFREGATGSSKTGPTALPLHPSHSIALPLLYHHHHLVPTVLLVGMSTVSPPPYINGYASPAPYVAAGSPPPASKPSAHPKPKPVNVFSNDGSFLERFQRIKKVSAADPWLGPC